MINLIYLFWGPYFGEFNMEGMGSFFISLWHQNRMVHHLARYPTNSSWTNHHQLFPKKKGAWKMGYWNRPETWQKYPCSGHRWLSVASPMASKTHCMWQVVGSKPTIFQRWDWPLTNFTYDKCTWQVSGWLGVSSRLTLWLGKFPHTTRIYLQNQSANPFVSMTSLML